MIARRNPAAKLVAALLIAVGLVPAIDPVTPAVVLAAVAVLLPFCGLEARRALTVLLPLLLAAGSVGLVNLVFGESGPEVALGLAVRLMAIALPGVLVALTSDPTDTADALVQRLRLPERPAIGVLAALRMVPLLAEQWHTLALARRARGLDPGRSPAAAVRRFAGMAFALLVRAVRTGTQLATAMDARGFGTGPRTRARTSVWRGADTALVAGALTLIAAAHAVSLWAGTWRLLFT
ncbi:energy-coupling factor transporter transmembrane component T family protein [Nocardiopsis coralliicola]